MWLKVYPSTGVRI